VRGVHGQDDETSGLSPLRVHGTQRKETPSVRDLIVYFYLSLFLFNFVIVYS
jgi:hypothetical protein